MKKTVGLAVMFILGGFGWADDLSQAFENAYFLETARAQPQEALEIYGQIVQSDVSDEARPIVIRSLERMLVLHKRLRDRTFQDKVDNFDWYPDDRARVVDVFGEPESYLSRNRVCIKENLPRSYSMQYPKNFSVSMMSGRISYVSIKDPEYEFNGLSVGCSLDEVLEVFPPSKIIDGEEPEGRKEQGVLYKNSPMAEDHSYPTRAGPSLFFIRGKLHSITLHSPMTFSTKSASADGAPE